MADLEEFFVEQDKRMNLPDEDMDAYVCRRLKRYKKSVSAVEKSSEHRGSDIQYKSDTITPETAAIMDHSSLALGIPDSYRSPESGAYSLKRKMLEPNRIEPSLDKRQKRSYESVRENRHIGASTTDIASCSGTFEYESATGTVYREDSHQKLHVSAPGQVKPEEYIKQARSSQTVERIPTIVHTTNINATSANISQTTSIVASKIDNTASAAQRAPSHKNRQELARTGTQSSTSSTTVTPNPAVIFGVLEKPRTGVQGTVVFDHPNSGDEGNKTVEGQVTSEATTIRLATAAADFTDSTHDLSVISPSQKALPEQYKQDTKYVVSSHTLLDVTTVGASMPSSSSDSLRSYSSMHISRHQKTECNQQNRAFKSPKRAIKANTTPNASYITTPGGSHLGSSSRRLSVSSVSSVSSTSVNSSPVPAGPEKSNAAVNASSKSSSVITTNTTKQAKKKEKATLITPLEYAQTLQLKLDLPGTRKTNYLRGKYIFYAGGDMQYASAKTRGRMDYIVKHGGILCASYDPDEVTHIVTDAGSRPTLRALGLKSLADIPNHIATVKWSWVISGLGRSGYDRARTTSKSKAKGKETAKMAEAQEEEEVRMDYEFLHAAFPERIEAGRNWQKLTSGSEKGKRAIQKLQAEESKAEMPSDDGEFSRISEFTQDPQSSTDRQGRTKTLAPSGEDISLVEEELVSVVEKGEDPLAEFYAQAKAERDAATTLTNDESDTEEQDDEPPAPKGERVKKGFTCDNKVVARSECVNQDIVEKLEELMELHKARASADDHWRVIGYSKCIRALKSHPKRIISLDDARTLTGVGEKTAQKIMEIIETGGLRRIEHERTGDIETTSIFMGIYGVGRATALMWYSNGCRTLDDIKNCKGGIKLSTAQEIGLKHYDDINSRMPRAEARHIFDLIKKEALRLDAKLFIEIMGSFRRGKADCGDIDILLTRPVDDGNTHAGILSELLRTLHACGILTEDLSLPDDFTSLELSYRGLCHIPRPGTKQRRIDILCVPWKSRGAALLYFTGDDIFNRAMRLKANVMGYSLNQRGLYKGVVRDPRDRRVKLCDGTIIASETEEEIFKILNVPWQEPHERVRG